MEKQNGRAYTFEEAKEIGEGLIDFHELLARLDDKNSKSSSYDEI